MNRPRHRCHRCWIGRLTSPGSWRAPVGPLGGAGVQQGLQQGGDAGAQALHLPGPLHFDVQTDGEVRGVGVCEKGRGGAHREVAGSERGGWLHARGAPRGAAGSTVCRAEPAGGGGGGALAASQLHQQQRYFLLNARHQDGVPLPEQALTSARHSASRMQEERKSKSGICSTWGRGRRGGGGGKGRAGGAAGGSTNDQSCKPARSALVLLPPSKDSDQAPPPSLPLTLNPGRW